MLFLPISLALFLLFLLLIPVLFVLAPAVAFAKLGLNPYLSKHELSYPVIEKIGRNFRYCCYIDFLYLQYNKK
jgi:hypothetical protein